MSFRSKLSFVMINAVLSSAWAAESSAKELMNCYQLRQPLHVSFDALKRKEKPADRICLRRKLGSDQRDQFDLQIRFESGGLFGSWHTAYFESRPQSAGIIRIIGNTSPPPEFLVHYSKFKETLILTDIELLDAQTEKRRWVSLYLSLN